MVEFQDGPLRQSRTAMPPAAGGSISGMRVLMGLVLFVIAIASIMGVVVALSTGQTTVALIVALVATAFFARVGC